MELKSSREWRSEWNCAAQLYSFKMPLANNQRSLSIGIVRTELLANSEGPGAWQWTSTRKKTVQLIIISENRLDNFRVYLSMIERKVDRSRHSTLLSLDLSAIGSTKFPTSFPVCSWPCVHSSGVISSLSSHQYQPTSEIEELCPIFTSISNWWKPSCNEGCRPISSWSRGRCPNNQYHY